VDLPAIETWSWLPSFIASLVVSGILALPILRLLIALKSRQTVSQHLPEHAAKQGTPTMGGLIIAVGFLGGMIATLASAPVDQSVHRYLLGFVVVFAALTLIGFIDDYLVPRLMAGKRGLGWTQKLVLQILCAGSFLWVGGLSVNGLEASVGIVVVLFFSNAYNFSDGLDALAGSLLVAICLGLGIVAVRQGHQELLVPIFALVGGAIPFLALNRPPAKVFMGDVGSLPIGGVLGLIVATIALPGWHAEWHAVTPDEAPPFMVASWPIWLGLSVISFVMIAELVPVPLQILSVKIRKKRIFPATPIHHSFQRAGWKETRVVGMFVGVQLTCSLLGAMLAIFGLRAINENDKQVAFEHIQEIKRGLKP